MLRSDASAAPNACKWSRASRPRTALSADTIAAIVAKTDGVPLFVEELTRSVMESAGEDSAVPATLKDSLMARLDRLGGAREVAQIAAVIGRQFTLRFAGSGYRQG